jgi:hypothetical protein
LSGCDGKLIFFPGVWIDFDPNHIPQEQFRDNGSKSKQRASESLVIGHFGKET